MDARLESLRSVWCHSDSSDSTLMPFSTLCKLSGLGLSPRLPPKSKPLNICWIDVTMALEASRLPEQQANKSETSRSTAGEVSF